MKVFTEVVEAPSTSHIELLAYDGITQELGVRFRSGDEYIYHHVPSDKWVLLWQASSKGQALNRYVKNTDAHPVQKQRFSVVMSDQSHKTLRVCDNALVALAENGWF